MNFTSETPIPFGKYKGQPAQMLLADREYCDWVMTQAGFVERYPGLIEFLNHGERPSSTPLHNALQAKFLDDSFCKAFLHLMLADDFFGEAQVTRKTFEFGGFDVFLHGRVTRDGKAVGSDYFAIECKPTLSDEYPSVLRQIRTAEQVLGKTGRNGFPGHYKFEGQLCLVVGSFNSSAITFDQAVEFFKSARVVLALASEIEDAKSTLELLS